MSLADQVEQLRGYPQGASESFRDQLERMRDAIERFDGKSPAPRGIDRSNELTPVARPTIVRTLVNAGGQ